MGAIDPHSVPAAARMDAARTRLDARIDWERRERTSAWRQDLAQVRDLLARLGDPQSRFRAVHVAGSKGKGSVASLVAAGLAAAGQRVGVYASPHVERIQERVRIAGREVEDELFAPALEAALDVVEGGLKIVELAPDVTEAEIREKTAANLV